MLKMGYLKNRIHLPDPELSILATFCCVWHEGIWFHYRVYSCTTAALSALALACVYLTLIPSQKAPIQSRAV